MVAVAEKSHAQISDQLDELFHIRNLVEEIDAERGVLSVSGEVKRLWLELLDVIELEGESFYSLQSKARDVLLRGTNRVSSVVGHSLEEAANGSYETAWNCWANALPDRVWNAVIKRDFLEARHLPWEGVKRKIDVVKHANRIRPIKDRKPLKPPSKQEVQQIIRSGNWKGRMQKWSKKIVDYDKVAEKIAAGVTQGKTADQVAKSIEPHVQSFSSSAKRIVRTEAARISNQMAEKTFQQFDNIIAGYRRQAILDGHTRPLHRHLNGKTYWKKKQPWASTRPQLPDAPNCRCTYSPVLDESVDEMSVENRKEEKTNENLETYTIVKNWPDVPKGTYYLPPGMTKAEARNYIAKNGLKPGGQAPVTPLPIHSAPPPVIAPVERIPPPPVAAGAVTWKNVETLAEAREQAEKLLNIRNLWTSRNDSPSGEWTAKCNASMQAIADAVDAVPLFKKQVLKGIGSKVAEFQISIEGYLDDRPGLMGSYNRDTGRMRLLAWKRVTSGKIGRGFGVDDSVMGTARHEFGHFVHYSVWAAHPQSFREWKDIYDQMGQQSIKQKVSIYAATNPNELFAESFCKYTHPNYKPGSLPFPVESYFKKYLGERESGPLVSIPKVGEEVVKKLTPTSSTMVVTIQKNWPGVPKGTYTVPAGLTKAQAREYIKNQNAPSTPIVSKPKPAPVPMSATPPHPGMVRTFSKRKGWHWAAPKET